MTKLDDHPTVIRHRERPKAAAPQVLDADWLRRVCLEAGADDVGFVAIDRPEVDDQRAEILSAFPATRTLVSFVCRLNREPIRSPARSVANQEFHANYEHVNEVARRVVRALGEAGVPAMNPTVRVPDGDGPIPRPDLGRLAQADRRRRRAGAGRHPPMRHPPGLRQLHQPGDHPGGAGRLGAGACRSTTTRASSASSAWPPARSAPSAPTATSTSRPA